MTQNKTKATKLKVSEFIAGIDDVKKRNDCREVMKLMREVTGNRPRMWGTSMVGYGNYHYKYASGREGDLFITGFSPRKQALTLYVIAGFDAYQPLMDKLGKYKTGKSCLYIKKLDDIDRSVLRQLLEASVRYMRETYPAS